MIKTLTRPAMIFIPFILGVCFPQVHVLNKPPVNIIRYVLMIMVFMSCLQIRFTELKPRRDHLGLLIGNLLMGIVPYYLLLWLCPGKVDFAKAAFFTGITPTATAAPVVIAFLNGRVGFGLTGFTITNCFVSLSLLLLLPLVTGTFSASFIGHVALTLFQIIGLPFLVAVILRRFWPQLRELPKRCKNFTFSLWSFALFVIAAIARQYFIDHPDAKASEVLLVAGISLVICICNFTLGNFIARKRYKRECSQLLGQKNTTFTMYLALTYAGPLVAMGPIFYVLWHNTWNAWQMYRYDRRLLTRQLRVADWKK